MTHPSIAEFLMGEKPKTVRAFVNLADLRRQYSETKTPVLRPRGNPCRIAGEHASYAVSGLYADGSGGGVIYWAFSLHEAMEQLRWVAEKEKEYRWSTLAIYTAGEESDSEKLLCRLQEIGEESHG